MPISRPFRLRALGTDKPGLGWRLLPLLLGFLGCTEIDVQQSSALGSIETAGATGSSPNSKENPLAYYLIHVKITLDGAPPQSPIKLKQGGVDKIFKTNNDGHALMNVQLTGVGQIVIHASHPDARVGAKVIEPEDLPTEIVINLKRFDQSDNPEYKFIYPGTPEDQLSCAHCHNAINEQWYGTPHQRSASNPFLHDVYAGVVSALNTQVSCTQAGGKWLRGVIPGQKEPGYRCYLGPGALPDLNPHCGNDASCDTAATDFGGCADCHAPGLNGQIGHRNLLEARGTPYKFGIHCDVCHRVESVDLQKAPGVAGALRLLRPSEPPFASFLQNLPLTFGPFMDVSNYEMGAVQRDHFGQSRFCAACHDYEVDVKPRWGPIDQERWPSGKLPVQSTYQEWREGPMNPGTPCGSCHMPPNPAAWNGADLERFKGGYEQSARAGWMRPAGSVRDHTWVGPRAPSSGMLESAAALNISSTIDKDGNHLYLVEVKNVGAGHALPTGLPARSLILLVKAFCDGQELPAIGGNVVPAFAGETSRRLAEQDWTKWPEAKSGDKIRVLRENSSKPWIDYQGPGRFGSGGFRAEEKGLSNLVYVGESTVVAQMPDGTAKLDKPLPEGDIAVLAEAANLEGGPPRMLSGAPGFAFARVFADRNGELNVPSFRAADVVSDNRIPPQSGHQSRHVFAGDCATQPKLRATLLYRSFPPSWIRHWRWDRDDRVILQHQHKPTFRRSNAASTDHTERPSSARSGL